MAVIWIFSRQGVKVERQKNPMSIQMILLIVLIFFANFWQNWWVNLVQCTGFAGNLQILQLQLLKTPKRKSLLPKFFAQSNGSVSETNMILSIEITLNKRHYNLLCHWGPWDFSVWHTAENIHICCLPHLNMTLLKAGAVFSTCASST